jgi:predicted kinase
MPTLWMLVGVPASGKTAWLRDSDIDWNRTTLLSTDNIIEREAALLGKTYSDMFSRVVKQATREMNQRLKQAVADNRDIVWDQTNITVASRKSKLDKIPATYQKIAVYFPVPDTREWQRRLNSRPGKIIPQTVLVSMSQGFAMPSQAEGFDKIIDGTQLHANDIVNN